MVQPIKHAVEKRWVGHRRREPLRTFYVSKGCLLPVDEAIVVNLQMLWHCSELRRAPAHMLVPAPLPPSWSQESPRQFGMVPHKIESLLFRTLANLLQQHGGGVVANRRTTARRIR